MDIGEFVRCGCEGSEGRKWSHGIFLL
jgi:hypothetical protein